MRQTINNRNKSISSIHRYVHRVCVVYMKIYRAQKRNSQVVHGGRVDRETDRRAFILGLEIRDFVSHGCPVATKHRIGYIGYIRCIGHIGVQIMLLLDMTQYKVVKGKRLGSVLVKQFSRAQPGWGLGTRI